MKKQGIILLLLSLIVPNIAISTYCWVQKSSIITYGRYAAMGFSIGTKGYVTCGASFNAFNDLWEFDATTNVWSQKANYPGGNIWAGAGFSIGNKGYVTVGTLGTVYPTDTYEYDPTSNTWTSKAPFPGNDRQDCWGFTIGNYGYVAGGWHGNYLDDCWRYDPNTDSWSQVASFGGGARSGLRGFIINGIAYAIGGLGSTTSGSNEVWAYDPNNNTWTLKAALPGTGRHSCACFEMGGKGIAGGGFNGSTGFFTFYEYNTLNNQWSPIVNYNINRPLGYPVCFTIGSNGYIATGKDGNGFFNNETYMLAEAPSATIGFAADSCGHLYSFTANSINTTSYSWNFGDGNTSTSQNPSNHYQNPGTYTVTLTVSNGACTTTTTQNVNVPTSPNANFSAIIDTCALTLNFTNSSQNAGSYLWDFGDGQTSTLTSPSHVYSNPGTYNVTLIAASSTITGCKDTALITYNISLPNLAANATLTPDCSNGVIITNFTTSATSYTWLWGDGNQTSGPVSFHQYSSPGTYNIRLALSKGNCKDTVLYPVSIGSGPTANFNVTSNCDLSVNISNLSTAGITYQWNWGNNQSATGPISNYQYNQPGPYSITLIATQGICADTITQNITVYTPVTSAFSLSTNCSDGISITNASQGATTYSWDWGNGILATGLQTDYTYSNSGNYTVTLISSNNDCSDTSYQNIIVQSTPIAQITSQFSNCHDSLQLWSGNSASNYSWIVNNSLHSNDSLTTLHYTTTTTAMIQLIASNNNCHDTDNVTMQLIASPDAHFTATISCDGSVQASPTITNQSTYIWNNGLGFIDTTEVFNYTYPPNGNYYLELTVSNGYCFDTASHHFSTHTLPTYTLNYSIDTCSKNVQATIQPDTAVNIIWNLGDGSHLTGNPIIHQFNSSQVFTNIVYIDTTTNCGDTITFDLDLTKIQPVSEISIPNSFSPNNDSKNDFYKLNQEICDFLNIKIYNRWGQVVFESTDQYFMWDGKFSGTELPEGVYLLFISTKTGQLNGAVSILR